MAARTRTRTASEWATFAVSAVVLVVVTMLLLVEINGTPVPAFPVATTHTDEIVRQGDRHRVPVTVQNQGDRTATNVQVVAELATDDGVEHGDQTIAFLGGDERVELVFLFTADPRQGGLTVAVTGYAET